MKINFNLTASPRAILLTALGLCMGGLAYSWYSGTYLPKSRAIEALQAHEQRLSESNMRARSTIANLGLDKIEAALKAYDQQAEHVARLVPKANEREPLLPKLTAKARDYGVRIEQMTPISSSTINGFQAEGFSLTILGTYHDVGAFLAALLSERRITQIHSVKLTATQVADPQFPRPAGAIVEPSAQDQSWMVRSTLRYLAFYGDGNAGGNAGDQGAPARSSQRVSSTSPEKKITP